jgi:hypothetical protein
MNPILHAVSRLLDSPPGTLGGLSAAELSDSLSGEPRLRMATRLALVKVAARCEQPDPVAPENARTCAICAPMIARKLERLARADDAEAMAGLVELAPALRDLSEDLRRDRSVLAVLPQALLELLRARLH